MQIIWVFKSVENFIKSVKETVEHRRKMIDETPKKKKWVVEPMVKGGKLSFKLSGQKQRWKAAYYDET